MITRLSKIGLPSSSSRHGILPSGFCWRSVSISSRVLAGTSMTRSLKPSTSIAMRTLRPNGEVTRRAQHEFFRHCQESHYIVCGKYSASCGNRHSSNSITKPAMT